MSTARPVAEPIAIIGMAGRFPAAESIDEFWENIAAGRDCITEISDEELLRYRESPERLARANYVRRRPVLSESDAFDAQLFGMTPRDAELHDPQYRLMLEIAHAVLEHAGYDPMSHTGQIGMFAGTNVNRYRYDYIEKNREVVNNIGMLPIDVANHPDYLSTYTSYKLGLRGPSATVLTACSTSLVAVHLACVSIRAGDCDMALAGGVDIEFPFHRGYVPVDGGLSAQDGVLRAFDADASGTNFGDGVGAVLLKPLSDALRDGDAIYATILGSAINNDGDRKVGFTAPSVAGQSECIRKALQAADVSPADIDYLEAHGTGTRVGDPIELAGLIEAYQQLSPDQLRTQYCALGSVKSNVGHLGQAAGVVALIKTTLALQHRQLPPTINVATPNPAIDWTASPFYLNTELRPWPEPAGQLRLAGVSSFGVGGTNAHVIVQEAPPRIAAQPEANDHKHSVLWSAMDDRSELLLRERLARFFDDLPEPEFRDAVHTLRIGRNAKLVRAAVRATSASDAASLLRDSSQIIRADGTSRSVAFAFPGQGGLFPTACLSLYDEEPVFRSGCDTAFEVLNPLLDVDLRRLWRETDDPARLADTALAQPLLYTLEYTFAHWLQHCGVAPDLLFGHSLGELVAASVAGVFDFESGLRAVAARAISMAAMPPGRMLAVDADAEAVSCLLGHGLALAAVNGPTQVVLSGPEDRIAAAAKELAGNGVTTKELATSHGFHAPAMADAAAQFASTLRAMRLYPPQLPVVSSATGKLLTDGQACSPDFWSRQLVEPVYFDRAAHQILGKDPTTIIETGPGRTLATLLRGRPDLGAGRHRVMAPLRAGSSDRAGVEDLFTRLWVDGHPISYWQQADNGDRRRIAVPGYPYQRKRYWLDIPAAPTTASPAPATTGATTPAPSISAPTPDTATVRQWQLSALEWEPDRNLLGSSHSEAGLPIGSAVVLVPEDRSCGRLVQTATQRAGHRVIRVTDRRRGGSGEAIDPGNAAEWLPLLEKLTEHTPRSVTIVHAALLAEKPHASHLDGVVEQTERVAGLLTGLQGTASAAAAFQRRHHIPTRLLLLGRGLVDVTGGEPVDPAAAALVALLRTAAQELPGVRCQAIDLSPATPVDALSEAIRGEGPPIAALRGRRMWRPVLVPVDPDVTRGAGLRPNGTYLITGGLGGIGLVAARALAETGMNPRIALLGRTALSDISGPVRSGLDAELAAVREAGAEVEVVSADVGDPGSLAAAVTRIERSFGPTNGVLHAAGIAGGGLLERRGADDLRAVLHPKVAGVLALEQVFADRGPVDFMMLFSSQAGLSGLYGSADYAAANAFLDAHARRCVGADRRTVSVQWPGWAEVGMLARSDSAQTVLAAKPQPGIEATREAPGSICALHEMRAPGKDWEFDEHVFDGVPVLPGTALIDLAVRAAQKIGVSPDDGPIELRGTAFLAPVVGDEPKELRVLLTPMGATHRFQVQAKPADTDQPWTDHATGIVGPTEQEPAADLTALAQRLEPLPTPELAHWIAFGPRWGSVVETRGDDGERLARLVMPDEYHADFADHPVHPALLDTAPSVLADVVRGHRYAPFLYRRIAVFAPLTTDVTVHIRFTDDRRRPRPVDFDIYDTDTGVRLLRAESFAVREVTAAQFGTAAPPARPSAPAATAGNLLTPEVGAAALMELLRGSTPPVVMVDVPENRLVIPDMPYVGQARTKPGADEAPEPAAPPTVQVEPTKIGPKKAAGSDDVVLDTLRGFWVDALGIVDVGADDDFFDLGGTSLSAVQVAARTSARFGVEIGAGMLFDASTPAALAREVRSLGGGTSAADVAR